MTPPATVAALQAAMAASETTEWLEGLEPFNTEAQKISELPPAASKKAFFVEIGGGYGHQCINLAKKYPGLERRLIFQDLPEVVNKLPPIDGVRIMAHSLFEKQIIRGSRFYYLRQVLRNWPDDEVIKILQNIAANMSHRSRILIDDIVLPDSHAPWQATLADMLLMIGVGTKERSRKKWESLAERAGLRIEQVHSYVKAGCPAVVVLALK